MNQHEWNSEPDMRFDKTLDEALARLAFEDSADITADYAGESGQLGRLLETAVSLKALQPVALPQAASLAAGREAFLAGVDQLPAQAVSPPLLVRLKEWITTSLSPISESFLVSKEAKPMSTILLRIAIVVAVLFGAAGGTAIVSAESLPDSALYPVKLALEDTRLALTADPAEEAELNLILAETRLEEIEVMSLAGNVPDEAVFNRLEKHFDEALQLAAGMPEEAMAGFLVRTQDRIRIQENALAQTQARLNGPGEESIGQANGILTRLRLRVESGLQEPQLFRRQNGRMFQGTSQESGPCNDGNCDPAGNGNQYGPGSAVEPGPAGQGGYGPGPGDGDGICDNTGDCEPAGNANQYGQGPAPEAGYGPGPGEGNCEEPGDCEPVGDANQYGQGSAGETGYGPGPGDGSCEGSGNCEPAGDANQHGQNGENGQQSNQNNGNGGG